MDFDYASAITQAERNFSKARAKAFWSTLWSRLSGHSASDELLSFEEVKRKLRLSDERYLGLHDVPLDKIVGSVGRYRDFTRKFLPKKTVNRDRWKAVDMMTLGKGYPPIELYKIGDAYFVLDGNHRVSVARANELETIEAYVTELRTEVPFDSTTTATELFAKEAFAYFLRETRIRILRPEAEVILTEAVNYGEILEHIRVHHYYLGLDCDCPVPWYEGVASWYDHIYQPLVQVIREHDMLEEFPDRSEADMYVWLIRHQAALQEEYGGDPASPEAIAVDFLQRYKA